MVPGDSGGALREADGDVVGMNVAGSTNTRAQQGYCIPMDTVMADTDAIVAGQASSTVTLGHTAALGISVATQTAGLSTTQGVAVAGVFDGKAADQAGITAGSVITSLDGQSITTQTQLAAIVANHKPGDTIEIAWTDPTGQRHDSTITLGEAPLA
jgi:S1-C subfamily serine protease